MVVSTRRGTWSITDRVRRSARAEAQSTTPLPSTGRPSFPATGCGPPDQNRFNRLLLPLAAHGLKSRAGGRSVALAKLGVYPAVMARYLFATWEGGGHVQPMLLAARGLMSE